MLLVLLWAPIPLGSNRPWAWLTLSAVAFFLIAMRSWARREVQDDTCCPRPFALSAVLYMFYPLLQIIPFPLGTTDFLSLGVLQLNSTRPISLDVQLTIEYWIRQSAFILFGISLASATVSHKRRLLFVKGLFFMGIFLTVIGLMIYWFSTVHPLSGKPARHIALGVSSTFVNKNHYAGWLIMILPLSLWYVLRKWKGEAVGLFSRLWGFFSLSILFIGLVLSGSRGAVAAMIGGFLITYLVSRLRLCGMIIVFFLVAAVGSVFLFPSALESIVEIVNDPSAQLRIRQWIDTLAGSHDFWLFGSGLGTYDAVFPSMKSEALGYLRFDHAHNDYIELYVTLGVVGLVFWLLLSLSAIIQGVNGGLRLLCRSGAGFRFAAVWACFSFLLHGLIDFNMQIPANFLLFFSILSMLGVNRKKSPGMSD